MSLQWYERVPKSADRPQLLARMTEGEYLGILRRAALRHFKDDPARTDALQQASLAARLNTRPKTLREMEEGHREPTAEIRKVYCELMGLSEGVLRAAGKRPEPPSPPPPPPPPPPPTGPVAGASEGARSPGKRRGPPPSEDERQRAQKLLEERRLIDGVSCTAIDMSEARGVVIRNQLDFGLVCVLALTTKGTLMIDVFADGRGSSPTELLKAGFPGVRVAAPQAITYDFDHKKKVTEARVPTTKQQADD